MWKWRRRRRQRQTKSKFDVRAKSTAANNRRIVIGSMNFFANVLIHCFGHLCVCIWVLAKEGDDVWMLENGFDFSVNWEKPSRITPPEMPEAESIVCRRFNSKVIFVRCEWRRLRWNNKRSTHTHNANKTEEKTLKYYFCLISDHSGRFNQIIFNQHLLQWASRVTFSFFRSFSFAWNFITRNDDDGHQEAENKKWNSQALTDSRTHPSASNWIYIFRGERENGENVCRAHSHLLGWPLLELNKWMIFQQFARYVRQIHVVVGIVGTAANHHVLMMGRISEIRHAMILRIHFDEIWIFFFSIYAAHTTIWRMSFVVRLLATVQSVAQHPTTTTKNLMSSLNCLLFK